MDSKLREILASCIREMESGASMESCLERFPGQADGLRPHLALWAGLASGARTDPEMLTVYRGQRVILAGLATVGGRTIQRNPRFLTPAVVRVLAVVAGALFLLGGGAGGSTGAGGPDPGGGVFDHVLVTKP